MHGLEEMVSRFGFTYHVRHPVRTLVLFWFAWLASVNGVPVLSLFCILARSHCVDVVVKIKGKKLDNGNIYLTCQPSKKSLGAMWPT